MHRYCDFSAKNQALFVVLAKLKSDFRGRFEKNNNGSARSAETVPFEVLVLEFLYGVFT